MSARHFLLAILNWKIKKNNIVNRGFEDHTIMIVHCLYYNIFVECVEIYHMQYITVLK